jgi:hypothetical protein
MKRAVAERELINDTTERERDAVRDRLRAAVRINMMRIDEELIENPSNLMECGEQVAFAANFRDTAHNGVEYAEAIAADELRRELIEPVPEPGDEDRDPPARKKPGTGKRRSEAQIKSEIPNYPAVKRAQRRLEDAKLEFSLWMAIMEGLRAKSASLENVSRLIISGYISNSSVTAVRRAEIRNAGGRGTSDYR